MRYLRALIENIPLHTPEQKFREYLEQTAGPVELHLINNESAGYAVVWVPKPEARRAILNLHGTEWNGKQLLTRIPHFNLIVTQEPQVLDEEALRSFIVEVTGETPMVGKTGKTGETYLLLEARTEEHFRALLERNGAARNGTIIEIRTPHLDSTLGVQLAGLPKDASEGELLAHIQSVVGGAKRVNVVHRATTHFAFGYFRSLDERNRALAFGKRFPFRDRKLEVRPINERSVFWSLGHLEEVMNNLTNRVGVDVNYAALQLELQDCQHARQTLFSDGLIGIDQSVDLEKRIIPIWALKEERCSRAKSEFEQDLLSIEESLELIDERSASWEEFGRIARDLLANEDYLQSIDFPKADKIGYEKRLVTVGRKLGKTWLDRVGKALASIEEMVASRHPAEADEYDEIATCLDQEHSIKQELEAFVAILHDPPLQRVHTAAEYKKIEERERELWSATEQEIKRLCARLRTSSSQMAAAAAQSFLQTFDTQSATLREKCDRLDNLKELLGDVHVRLTGEVGVAVTEAEQRLREERGDAFKRFIAAKNSLQASLKDPRDPQQLLQVVKDLQAQKKALPFDHAQVLEFSRQLNEAWEMLTQRIAESHRIESEELSRSLAALKESAKTESIRDLGRKARAFNHRIRNSDLSYRWKSVLQNEIGEVFALLRERENVGREEANQMLEEAATALDDTRVDLKRVRDLLHKASDRMRELELRPAVRDDLNERLQKMLHACESQNEAEFQRLEPLVVQCEGLAAQGAFDRVFSEIHRLQQEINKVGISRRLWPLRERLNTAWTLAQDKQHQQGQELAAALQERVAVCQQLADDEPDLFEVRAALDSAWEAWTSRPKGLRIEGGDTAWEESLRTADETRKRRELELGNSTRTAIEEKVNAIRKSLTATRPPIARLFSDLHALNDFYRSHWKNKWDMDSLRGSIDGVWQSAKEVASQRRTAAVETVNETLVRLQHIVHRWFDFAYVRGELADADRLIRRLPLHHDAKASAAECLEEMRNELDLRQQKDASDAFSAEWLQERRAYCIERKMVEISNPRWKPDYIDFSTLTERELFVLAHVYDIIPRFSTDRSGVPFVGIEYDERTLEHVVIRKFSLPRIWAQPFTRIRIDFPRAYPDTPPIGWYMDKDLSLRNWTAAVHYFPDRAYHGAQPRQGWAWYCCTIHDIHSPGGWRPSTVNNPRLRDNLWSFLDVVRGALSSDV